jgi:hypothetical protein
LNIIRDTKNIIKHLNRINFLFSIKKGLDRCFGFNDKREGIVLAVIHGNSPAWIVRQDCRAGSSLPQCAAACQAQAKRKPSGQADACNAAWRKALRQAWQKRQRKMSAFK